MLESYLKEPKISELLHLFLDLYERDSWALRFLLSEENPLGMLDDLNESFTPGDQYALIGRASQRAQREIRSKTLIESLGKTVRHAVLRDQFVGKKDQDDIDSSLPGPHIPLPELEPDSDFMESLYGTLGTGRIGEFLRARDEHLAEKHGLSLPEFKRRQNADLAWLALNQKKIDAELLRFFADRIDQVAAGIEKLDDTDFASRIPKSLVTPFRELHINAVLGNYGTAAILCGAVLESSLQDLLPTNSALGAAIEEAKGADLLMNHALRYAYKIAEARNAVIHGKLKFDSLTSDKTWELIDVTRILVRGLYQDRMEAGD
jgi:hypothetical protein